MSRMAMAVYSAAGKAGSSKALGRREIFHSPGQMAAHESALSGGALHFHPAVMQLDEPVNQRETETGARAAPGAAFGGEALEHGRHHVARDAGAAVRYPDLHVVADHRAAQGDDAVRRGEVERVG